MTRTTAHKTICTTILAGALGLVLAGPAPAQTAAGEGVTTGGAGNTGVAAPPVTGGVRAGGGARDLGPSEISRGNAASPSNSPVPGTTPGVNIGGTLTGGPPGTGGTAGGPSIGR